MPYLVCRSCGHQNETSARRCANCGVPEEELRAGTDLGPWWPLVGIFGVLAVLYAVARALGRDAVGIWLVLAALSCLAAGGLGIWRGSLRFRGRGPDGATARGPSAALLALGLAALIILIVRLARGG